MTAQIQLADAFNARKSFFSNRASAIFPIRIRNKADFLLLFFDYWLIKSGIKHKNLNIRIYDDMGRLKFLKSFEIVDSHNKISVRDLFLADGVVVVSFDGMVEVEVVSAENLSFSFPAIVGVYEADGRFSVVHSAGRIKNADEINKTINSQETNWNCIFERSPQGQGWSIIPFFHYFIGATPPILNEVIEVSLHDKTGRIVESKTINVGQMSPFSSKIFFADQIFTLASEPPADSFISVSLRASDVFPRLVVGNFHRDIDFLEVTHSFPVTEFVDHCPQPDDIKPSRSAPSLLAAQTAPGLDLVVRVFPTNCIGNTEVLVNKKYFDQDTLLRTTESFDFDSNLGTEGLSFKLDPDEEMRVLHLYGNTVPSRLNASYRYSVAGAKSRFTTDIATGAKSIVYPPKWRHWGHGCIGAGYNTYVLLRNNTHAPESTLENCGYIRIFTEHLDQTFKIQVSAESCIALKISELLNLDPLESIPTFFSWMITMNESVGETFWVSYREDGCIFGEHGF